MHLAFFIPSLAGGGAERIVKTLVNALVQRGHQVDLLLTSRRGPFLSCLDSRVSVVCLGCDHTIQTVPSLICVLRKRRPDVVVTSLLNATVAAYVALRWLRFSGNWRPALCTIVHSLLRQKAARAEGVRAQLLMHIARPVLREVESVIAVSDTARENLSSYTGRDSEKTTVIPNPFDIDAIQEKAQNPVSHKWVGQDSAVVVAVGRLCPIKNYPLLLRALSHLDDTRDVQTRILGAGSQRRALEDLSRKLGIDTKVDFMGFVKDPYTIISRADLLVLPSTAEAFGNVVVEALACGTPVIATESSGGPTELLEELDAGYTPLAPPDPLSLAEYIDATLNSTPNVERLRERARDFDLSAIVDQYVSVFERAGLNPRV